jgi:hypothetical protein
VGTSHGLIFCVFLGFLGVAWCCLVLLGVAWFFLAFSWLFLGFSWLFLGFSLFSLEKIYDEDISLLSLLPHQKFTGGGCARCVQQCYTSGHSFRFETGQYRTGTARTALWQLWNRSKGNDDVFFGRCFLLDDVFFWTMFFLMF